MKAKTESFLHSATYTPLSLAEFRQLFQISSPLFTSVPAERVQTHPLLGSTRANLLGLEIGAGKDLEDPFTLVTNFSILEGAQHEVVAYGEYTKYEEGGSMIPGRYVFMAMIERTLDPDLPQEDITGTDDDFIHMPHVAFHGIIRNVKGQERIEPLAMNVALGYDSEAVPVTAELQGNEELGRGLCYADSVLCQIIAGHQISTSDNIHWIQGRDESQVEQKIGWMRVRSYDDLKAQIAQAQRTPEKETATGPVI